MKFFIRILLLGFLLSASVQAQADCPGIKVVSPLENQMQVTSDWCSAASVRVVISHFVEPLWEPPPQCQLVADVVGMPCCVNQTGCHPDSGIWPSEIFRKIFYTYDPLYSKTTPPTGPPKWSDILREICTYNRPLVSVAALLDTTNLHAVVIEGYRIDTTEAGTTPNVRVFDPQEDLCDDPSCADTNPRFVTYDFWYKSGLENDTDYMGIGRLTLMPPPENLRVQ